MIITTLTKYRISRSCVVDTEQEYEDRNGLVKGTEQDTGYKQKLTRYWNGRSYNHIWIIESFQDAGL